MTPCMSKVSALLAATTNQIYCHNPSDVERISQVHCEVSQNVGPNGTVGVRNFVTATGGLQSDKDDAHINSHKLPIIIQFNSVRGDELLHKISGYSS